jgi:hypothetical protein
MCWPMFCRNLPTSYSKFGDPCDKNFATVYRFNWVRYWQGTHLHSVLIDDLLYDLRPFEYQMIQYAHYDKQVLLSHITSQLLQTPFCSSETPNELVLRSIEKLECNLPSHYPISTCSACSSIDTTSLSTCCSIASTLRPRCSLSRIWCK